MSLPSYSLVSSPKIGIISRQGRQVVEPKSTRRGSPSALTGSASSELDTSASEASAPGSWVASTLVWGWELFAAAGFPACFVSAEVAGLQEETPVAASAASKKSKENCKKP